MGKIAAHSASRMVFRQAIGCENERKPRVVLRGVRIVGPFFSIRSGIGLLIVQRIFNQRFQCFVMSRKRPVFKSTRNIEPSHTIGMQREGLRAAECLYAMSLVNTSRSGGGRFLVVVGIVE